MQEQQEYESLKIRHVTYAEVHQK